MSKKEYPEMAVSSVEYTTEEVTDYTVEEPVEHETVTEEPVEVKGVVVDCTKLNVRVEPTSNAEVVTTIPSGTEVVIVESESTDEFYKICTEVGVEGFCVRKFVNVLE